MGASEKDLRWLKTNPGFPLRFPRGLSLNLPSKKRSRNETNEPQKPDFISSTNVLHSPAFSYVSAIYSSRTCSYSHWEYATERTSSKIQNNSEEVKICLFVCLFFLILPFAFYRDLENPAASSGLSGVSKELVEGPEVPHTLVGSWAGWGAGLEVTIPPISQFLTVRQGIFLHLCRGQAPCLQICPRSIFLGNKIG